MEARRRPIRLPQIDRLIVKELIGPWVFGVGMFSSLLVAATYLGHLAGYLVEGVPPSMVFELTAMYLPAMIIKTFSMAMLLSSLLAFGRLSSDSEIVALRAGGASLYRIILPVALFSLLVAIFTFIGDEAIVPPAANKAVSLENQILHVQTQGVEPSGSYPIIRGNKLVLFITAAHVNPATGELKNVAVIVYDANEEPVDIMTAPLVKWAGQSDPTNFLVPKNGRIVSLNDPREDALIQGPIWPGTVPPIGISFGDLFKLKDDNFDYMSMRTLARVIQLHRVKGDKTLHDMANYEYGYWNKIALPLAALVFGCLGAVLGIRNHRTGTAAGFALAVAIIFGYFMLVNFMSVWALGGAIPAWVASFSPLVIGIVATVVIMNRRNI